MAERRIKISHRKSDRGRLRQVRTGGRERVGQRMGTRAAAARFRSTHARRSNRTARDDRVVGAPLHRDQRPPDADAIDTLIDGAGQKKSGQGEGHSGRRSMSHWGRDAPTAAGSQPGRGRAWAIVLAGVPVVAVAQSRCAHWSSMTRCILKASGSSSLCRSMPVPPSSSRCSWWRSPKTSSAADAVSVGAWKVPRWWTPGRSRGGCSRTGWPSDKSPTCGGDPAIDRTVTSYSWTTRLRKVDAHPGVPRGRRHQGGDRRRLRPVHGLHHQVL